MKLGKNPNGGGGILTLIFLIGIFGFPNFSGILRPFLLILYPLICIAFLIHHNTFRMNRSLMMPVLLYMFWLTFEYCLHRDTPERILQMLFCLLTMFASANYSWSGKDFIAIDKMFCVYFLYSIANQIVHPRADNILGSMALVGFSFSVLTHLGKGSFLLRLLLWTAALLSGSRASVLAMLIISLFLFACKRRNSKSYFETYFTRTLLNGNVPFFAMSIIVMFISYFYPVLSGSSVGSHLNEISRKYTNKNFFSGRQYIWLILIGVIRQHPYIGYGGAAAPAMFSNVRLSSHNLYLQTMLQNGAVGLALLFFLLYSVFCLCSTKTETVAIPARAVMLGVLLHECFEITLTQNNWHVGILYWAIFGIVLSRKNSKRRNES